MLLGGIIFKGFFNFKKDKIQDLKTLSPTQLLDFFKNRNTAHDDYSYDFKGANQIGLFSEDFNNEPVTHEIGDIQDLAAIEKITNLLKVFPPEGEMFKRMGPHKVTYLVAFRDQDPIAYVQFHEKLLRAVNTGFFGHEKQKISDSQSQIYQLISGRLKKIEL